MPDISWVTPRVAVSSNPQPSWVPSMVRQGITDVLDLRGEPAANGEAEIPEPQLYAGTSIRYHYVPMRDNGSRIPAAKYVEGVNVIKQVLASGGKILVHCAAGQSRSPSMVYAYLRSQGASHDEAWTQIHTARPVAREQYFSSADAALPQIVATPPSTGVPVAGILIGLGIGILAVSAFRRSSTPRRQLSRGYLLQRA